MFLAFKKKRVVSSRASVFLAYNRNRNSVSEFVASRPQAPRLTRLAPTEKTPVAISSRSLVKKKTTPLVSRILSATSPHCRIREKEVSLFSI